MIFGFEFSDSFSRNEFQLFLSSLFRGIFSLTMLKNEKKSHHHRKGYYLPFSDLESLVDQVFPSNKEVIERSEFVSLFMASKQINDIFTSLNSAM